MLSSPATVAAFRIEARALSKSFSGSPLFSDLAFVASAGLTAISGRNGAGKTTLLKILARLLAPSRGAVAVFDGSREVTGEERRLAVGWAGPDLSFYEDFSARENLRFFRMAAGRPASEEELSDRLARVGLEAAANRRVGAFSSGMKQRLRLAFVMLLEPTVLLLDEPSMGLDAEGLSMLADVVRQRRAAGPVVLASNDPRDFSSPEQTIELGRP
jgi:heme exporter protein A